MKLAQEEDDHTPSRGTQKTPKKYVLNVSPEVYDYIDKKCQSMTDTPDSILRRLFGLAPKAHGKEK